MKHEYYTERGFGNIITIRCHHCNEEWGLRFGWAALLVVLRVVMPAICILLIINVPIHDSKMAYVFAALFFIGGRYLPAYILCEYMRRTGNYEKFMQKD